MTEKAIRSNWMLALAKEECISAEIKWEFTFQDLIVLGAIHRSGIFREKIDQAYRQKSPNSEFRRTPLRYF